VDSRISPADALAAVCATADLDSTGVEILYDRANTVFKLAELPVVVRLRYTRGDAVWTERLAASVHVTAWLHDQGFACTWPLDVEQPIAADGYLATLWHYVPTVRQPWEDVRTLGGLLRELHGLGMPPVKLPDASPLSSLRVETERCAWLPDSQRSWVLARYEELSRQYADATWVLGQGLIHGDAWAENLIHGRDRVVLTDWDSVSYGPREQDIVPTLIRHRFGRPTAEWEQFCQAYGVDPGELPGLSVLKEMRELRTLVPYLRSTGLPQVKAEVARRIGDLMGGTQSEPWHQLNLAS
jgi:Ser/Thr protein kinase RdoA (MazF antagonist)